LYNNYQKINNQTEELEGNSEDYASLANELLKKMEKRKWWQI
jgi:syntaxin-binding protein 5